MPRFEVLAGNHSEGDVVHEKGTQFYSPLPLDDMFANKFRRLPDAPTTVTRMSPSSVASPVVTTQPPVTSVATGVEEKTGKSSSKTKKPPQKRNADVSGTTQPPDLSELGTDVSEKWTEAGEKGFKVFQTVDGYVLYKADNLSNPLTKEPLEEEDVADFISEF